MQPVVRANLTGVAPSLALCGPGSVLTAKAMASFFEKQGNGPFRRRHVQPFIQFL